MRPNRVRVAERLKILKDEIGLSLNELADEIDSSKTSLNSYVRGVALPPEKIVDNMVWKFNIDKEWLYFGTTDEYMKDYIKTLNVDAFIDSNELALETIYKEYRHEIEMFKVMNSINSNSTLKALNQMYSEIAYEVFYKTYNQVFKKYVKSITKDFIEKLNTLPVYKADWGSNGEGFIEILFNYLLKMLPRPRYGEETLIRNVARQQTEILTNKILITHKDAVERMNQVKKESIVDYCNRTIPHENEVEEYLNKAASKFNLTFDTQRIEDRELVELVKQFSIGLKRITEKR